MYIGELALWLGLAVLYGSPAVLAGFAVWVAVMRRLAVREEVGLEAAFGDRYRRYKARVPRWIGLLRHARTEAEPFYGLLLSRGRMVSAAAQFEFDSRSCMLLACRSTPQ